MMAFSQIFCLILVLFYSGYAQNTTSVTPQPPHSTTTPQPTCGAPPEISGGSAVAYGNPPRANYTCEQGRQLAGSESIQCRNGRWSNAPNCRLRFCPTPPRLSNGRYRTNGGSFIVGVTVRYECYNSYDMKTNNDNSTIVCQKDWTWTSSNGIECSPKDCGLPGEITNGNRTYQNNNTRINAEAVYTCNAGYRLIPPGAGTIQSLTWTSRCRAGGWTSLPSCTRRWCGPPEAVTNSTKLSNGQNKFGDSVTYQCNTGYETSGNNTISCLASGQWGAKPTCQRAVCSQPPNVSNAKIISHGDYTFGGRVNYECHKGYSTHTSTYIVCLSNKEWTEPPECKKMTCRKPPSINHGSRTWNLTDYDSLATYKCESRYKLISSDTIKCGEDSQWTDSPKCEIPNSSDGSNAAAQTDLNEESIPDYNSGQIVASLSIACTIFGITCLVLIILISIKVCPCASSKGNNWVQMS